MKNSNVKSNLKLKETSHNYQFVTLAPYSLRGKLRRESSTLTDFWIPAFAGMTFLEVASNSKDLWILDFDIYLIFGF
jgi:hypothetical protein